MTERKKSIFLVDDNPTNLVIGKNALIGKYHVFTIPSAKKLLEMLEKTIPDLILLDIAMPEMNGYEAIKKIKANEKTAKIPVVFLTAKTDGESEQEGLSLGAVDYILKPFSPPLLLKRIEGHLLLKNYSDNLQAIIMEKTKNILELKNAVLSTMAELVEWRDDIMGEHIGRTQKYLKIMVDELVKQNLYGEIILTWDIDLFLQASQLHDVGKIAIQDSILQKPGPLTPEEFDIMKIHTSFGVKVIEKIEKKTTEKAFLEHAKIFAGTHHEKWDGSGYPLGLSGGNIPLHGRLMAIADVYDALISERPYKKALAHEEAVKIIASSRGTHFDPVLTDVFLAVADKFDKAASDLTLTAGEKL